jgi:probable F420-dependent oxidoreductase
MKLGLTFANVMSAVRPDAAVEIARRAEEAGFDSLWTVEHVVVPGGYESRYPYNRSGRIPGGEDSPIPDPLIWLSYVAARTERIRLCTGVLVLPQRSPVVTAKAVATLDVLSGGRVTLGVGVGWLREEFEAIGVAFEERASRTEEAIAAMRTLWREESPTFEGTHYRFHDARMWPKPAQGVVPIVIGGHTPAAARRAGRLGDGYFPVTAQPEDMAALIATMRQAAEEAGRDPGTIEVTAGGWPSPETVARLTELGVSRLVVPPGGPSVESVVEGLTAAAAALSASSS